MNWLTICEQLKYQRVTDGRTDGQTDGIAVASTALAKRRAVKIERELVCCILIAVLLIFSCSQN